MPLGNHKKNVERHFVVNLCVGSTPAMPEGAKAETVKGLRQRNMYVCEYVEIVVKQMWIPAILQKNGIPIH